MILAVLRPAIAILAHTINSVIKVILFMAWNMLVFNGRKPVLTLREKNVNYQKKTKRLDFLYRFKKY